MHEADILAAQALTASFGWPHRLEDWALMQSLGKGVVAEWQGRLAGTALCWEYGADWATLGLIGVDGALQGQGVGRRMMLALMQQLEGRSLALHATQAGLTLYASLGFAALGRVVQHQGTVGRVAAGAAEGGSLVPASLADLAQLAALDRQATGMDRATLLGALLRQPGVVLLRDGAAAGFALARSFGRGQVLGPAVAASRADAMAMLGHLLAQRAGQFTRIDVPEACGLGPWLSALGLHEADTVIRMVRGSDPARLVPVHSVALASQAFG